MELCTGSATAHPTNFPHGQERNSKPERVLLTALTEWFKVSDLRSDGGFLRVSSNLTRGISNGFFLFHFPIFFARRIQIFCSRRPSFLRGCAGRDKHRRRGMETTNRLEARLRSLGVSDVAAVCQHSADRLQLVSRLLAQYA